MTESPRGDLTQLLLQVRSSEVPEARDRLYAAIYDDLRGIAEAIMRSEAPGHTLQPTGLVHEAYFKLIDQTRSDWQDRAHFLGFATRAMRQVLVDYARKRHAAKRGGDRARVTLAENLVAEPDRAFEIVDLDDALQKLSQLSQRMASVVEFRVFGGMSQEEIAEVLSVSVRTVAGDWSVARRWLLRELA